MDPARSRLSLRSLRLLMAAALCVACSVGCAGGAWKSALREDSPAAYYRFLRDHPDSRYAEEAKARLEFHDIARRPTYEAYLDFRERFPNSPLVGELRPLVEERAFERARAIGTAEAYEQFADAFAGGDFATRARGNAIYLREGGFGGDPAQLGAFAAEHPESDYAAEAARSAQIPDIRARTGFDRVGLRIEISPATPEPERIARAFLERATEQYRRSGIQLEQAQALGGDGGANGQPPAWLTIQHSEESVRTELTQNQISRPGIIATTRLELRIGGDGPPIWEQVLQHRVEPGQHLAGTSLLFGPTARLYWNDFFVPVASWQSNAALRALLELEKRPAAVDAAGDRAVVLYGDGDFQVIELSDPSKPVVLAEYQRPRDFQKFDGVRILGDQIAVFGEDGLELVRFGEEGPVVVAKIERGEIGSPVAVEPLAEGLVVASNRGLITLGADGTGAARVLRRDLKGLAVLGQVLVFADGESVFVTTAAMLRENRVLAQMRLGRAFGPGRVRAHGATTVVIGETGVLVLDTRDPSKPRSVAQHRSDRIGRVYDSVRVGDRIYLLGERGLQVLDGNGSRVVDAVDVKSRARLAGMGRHVVAVGEQSLQVVDTTPFSGQAAAAPRQR